MCIGNLFVILIEFQLRVESILLYCLDNAACIEGGGGGGMVVAKDLLKYVSKICRLNFEIVAVTRPCIRFFSFRWHFNALTE